MFQWFAKQVNIWVLLGGILVAAGLIVLLGLLIFFMPPPPSQAQLNQTVLTVIVAPSPTVSPTVPLFTSTPTAVSIGGVTIGSYVQITGTQGEGLRLRAGPGTDNAMRFVGMDDEVFRVKDGPKSADGFSWWYLEAPYDPSRSGWAASKYFKVVSGPVVTATPTP